LFLKNSALSLKTAKIEQPTNYFLRDKHERFAG
jgi:hypothetical protein